MTISETPAADATRATPALEAARPIQPAAGVNDAAGNAPEADLSAAMQYRSLAPALLVLGFSAATALLMLAENGRPEGLPEVGTFVAMVALAAYAPLALRGLLRKRGFAGFYGGAMMASATFMLCAFVFSTPARAGTLEGGPMAGFLGPIYTDSDGAVSCSSMTVFPEATRAGTLLAPGVSVWEGPIPFRGKNGQVVKIRSFQFVAANNDLLAIVPNGDLSSVCG